MILDFGPTFAVFNPYLSSNMTPELFTALNEFRFVNATPPPYKMAPELLTVHQPNMNEFVFVNAALPLKNAYNV